ncbi:hypothetical protein BCR41DRAFT_347159 [Lobosporangium transversale]|uniref:Uncharacterized protein n=1 Tax=Lobosporangium transversale TaxID=64571 RepID=A0A1Y2GYY1_9FUNG|nr:hypothetical protein BCR41DRAFT_347159 [Lobosporangium transversale]ORZ26971.1 hypothetical protein BCR41DRAFT_347159 [Lobosporangium transversale]|eukprot:XP_021884718.1 hypothetical protein BCR41DRAFT_347159 [Lobosporangium transversale]
MPNPLTRRQQVDTIQMLASLFFLFLLSLHSIHLMITIFHLHLFRTTIPLHHIGTTLLLILRIGTFKCACSTGTRNRITLIVHIIHSLLINLLTHAFRSILLLLNPFPRLVKPRNWLLR